MNLSKCYNVNENNNKKQHSERILQVEHGTFNHY